MGIGFFDPLRHPLLLGHAAAQGDDLLRVLLLRVGQRPQVAEHPVLRVLPDGAGIENHHVRLLGVGGEGEAARFQHPHELLAVRHVLLTAEGVHAGQGMGLPGGEHRPNPLFKFPLALKLRLRDQYAFSFQTDSSGHFDTLTDS